MNNVVIINQQNKNQVLNELSIKQFEELNIQIYGTYEEPLFKAKDIGELLEIKNIKDSIKHFTNKQKDVAVLTDSIGRRQESIMLTEQGLYKVLMKSRKPIAEKFQDWVCQVVEDIRKTGKYESQKFIENNTKSNLLIEQSKNKKINYIGVVKETDEYTLAKYGKTDFINDTLDRHRKTYGEQFYFAHTLECDNNNQLEKLIQNHNDLKSRHIKEYEGTKRLELLRLDNNFTINNLIELMKTLKKSMETKYSIELELSKELTKQKELDNIKIQEETKQKEIDMKLQIELKKLELEMRKLELPVKSDSSLGRESPDILNYTPVQHNIEQLPEQLPEQLSEQIFVKKKYIKKKKQSDIDEIENDKKIIKEYIDAKTIKSNVNSDTIKMNDLYNKYCEWINIQYPNNNI